MSFSATDCLDGLATKVNAVNNTTRKRVLFVAEAVTLAHITRPLVLAQSLNPQYFDIHFACAPGKDFLFSGTTFTRWPIQSIPEERFLRALAKGTPIYDLRTLEDYVENDLQILDQVKPDLVVGDFRLSLAVSAPLRKTTYVALVNAHWSPFSTEKRFPVPEIRLTRMLGVHLASALFHRVQPLVFAYHAEPMNRLRERHSLAALGNLLNVYTYADYTLYADVPSLVKTVDLPPNHRYIGPIFWSPSIDVPSWWNTLEDSKPIIYTTLGSSGQVQVLPAVIAALKELPVTVMLATAGRYSIRDFPANFWVADYLPGEKVVQRASLVVCSGGSATAYQALREGIPILGIPSNMDQLLTMSAIARAGAGILLRAGRMTRERFRRAVSKILGDESYRAAARHVAHEIAKLDAPSNFRSFIGGLL